MNQIFYLIARRTFENEVRRHERTTSDPQCMKDCAIEQQMVIYVLPS